MREKKKRKENIADPFRNKSLLPFAAATKFTAFLLYSRHLWEIKFG
jgi:hypothetical protein